ncbi:MULTISPECIES: DUF397 domain-containing protein [unclassified Streptomyces]|uniref:DUF397 domain-containing protein n=1 Tax=unclassified Streptomyces TaxID=2593676 RepID=UPI0018EE819F|nr:MULTISPECIES: DUF397 domain-containing protein [unclassified Streptomyces]MBJ6616424.1 DUF397 domain-containing protein [Streptomyces sp. I3(2020)]MBJ6627102.1 DUF397 domain-containing protein [Streptomyces sp. I4(2020)]MBJ6632719.1 DUF397 domain-containing protein [Streptomyces sp. I5]
MTTAAQPTDRALAWHTSSYSNGAGGECVECAITSTRAHVRDTKTVDGPVVTVAGSAWVAFLQALKKG